MNIDDTTIAILNPTELLSKEFLYSISEVEEPEEKARLSALAEIRAQELGIEKNFKQTLKAYNKAQDELAKEYARQNAKRTSAIRLEFDSSGKPMKTIDNFLQILTSDKWFNSVKYNLLALAPERVEDGKATRWTDADDAEAKHHIERKYKLRAQDCYDDAMRILFRQRQYHPIRDYLDTVVWDGENRIEAFLYIWARCENTPYTREVSRLIFAGGINRLYNAGCKFDDMAVLIGTKQGEGKSTLVKWLAIKDEWFKEVSQFDGDKGHEDLEGAWICEVSELLAMTKSREQEAVKAFLSRQNDHFRQKYDKRTEDHLRQCIFIGTTNRSQFISDKTGGRRFFPIIVEQNGYWLYDHEQECREYIVQCWAEAKARYEQGKMPPVFNRKLLDEAKQAQQSVMEEDWRESYIEEYLRDKQRTCVMDLWENALRCLDKPSRKDSNEIVLMMQNVSGWVKIGNTRFGNYGSVLTWERESSL